MIGEVVQVARQKSEFRIKDRPRALTIMGRANPQKKFLDNIIAGVNHVLPPSAMMNAPLLIRFH